MHQSRTVTESSHRPARRLKAGLAAAVSVLGMLALAVPAQAQGDGTAVHTTIVSQDPAAFTPWVKDGIVESVVQVGNQIVIGGTFTQIVKANGTTTYTRSGLAAFDATTGAVSTSFAPTLDGEVTSLAVAPDGTSVYVGGAFSTVNGITRKKAAQVKVADGSLVTAFNPKGISSKVMDIRYASGAVWIAGQFVNVTSTPRALLASLDPTTGALTNRTTLVFSGHHNEVSDPASIGTATIRELAITPDGTKLIAIGNFTKVDGVTRDQVAMIDISGPTATLSGWTTTFFSSTCNTRAFDTFMRDVSISPDGSYAVFATTGSYRAGTSCDTTSRLELTGSGAVTPTWINMTGGDTTTAVAIVGSVVYVGGHFRWSNNPNTGDNPGQAAIDRYGLAALDPTNGMPYAWNPTRERGYGVYDFFATDQGLWVGSDTNGLGFATCPAGSNPPCFQYHPRIGFFPLSGGQAVPSKAVGSAPGDVIAVGTGSTPTDAASSTAVNAALAPSGTTAMNSDSWSHARGAMVVGNTLYTAWDNRTLYASPLSAATIGARTAVNINAGPVCTASNQKWCGSTTSPAPPAANALSFQLDMPNVTSMFYDSGRVYYTLTGSSYLYYRYFEPVSGYVGGVRYTAGSVSSLANARGAFTTGGKVYFADNANSGRLYSLTFSGGVVSGSPVLVDSTRDWRARGLALRSAPAANQKPTAVISATCTFLDCQLDGTGSSDSDGSVASYSWDFGDSHGDTGSTVSHTYAAGDTYDVTLTVTDNGGLTDTVTKSVTVAPVPTSNVAFRAKATAAANGAAAKVVVPADVVEGDQLLTFVTANGDVAFTTPTGWTQIGEQKDGTPDVVTRVYSHTATATDAGTTVTVGVASGKWVATILAYSGVDTSVTPIVASAPEAATTATHASPSVAVATPGSWVVSYWADKGAGTTSWNVPSPMMQRATAPPLTVVSGSVSGAAGDTGGAVPTGTWSGGSATSSTASAKATSFSIVLATA